MQSQVQIVLNDIPAKQARAVKNALEPDNIKIPDDLTINIEEKGNRLIFSFESAGDMKHMISAIDEILEHTGIALKVTQQC